MPKVALIMGSEERLGRPSGGCVDVLKGLKLRLRCTSPAHTERPRPLRRSRRTRVKTALKRSSAAANKAAHLAGVIAGHTTLPVIGIPVKSSFMDGLDSLLSTVQMPTGIPVATVAVGGGDNARIWRRRCSPSNTRFSPKSCWRIASGMAAAIEADDKQIQEEL